MRHPSTFIGTILVLGSFSLLSAQIEATALLSNPFFGSVGCCDCDNTPPGIWLSHYPSGQATQVLSRSVLTTYLSPDGKKIAFVAGGGDSLYIMNNNGTDIRATGHAGIGCATCAYGAQERHPSFQWTTAGIFWFNNFELHRYIPETGAHSIVMDIGDIGTSDNGAPMIWMSGDGRKLWYRADAQMPANGSAMPYIVFSPDFSSYSVVGYTGYWGHGRGMLIDGTHVVIAFGTHREWDQIVTFDESGITLTHGTFLQRDLFNGNGDLVYRSFDDNGCLDPAVCGNTLPRFDPPFPEGFEAGFIFPRCVNNADIQMAAASSQGEYGDGECNFYIFNWRSDPPQLIGEFDPPSSSFHGFAMCMWYGPLPSPTDDPYIVLDQGQLTFVLEPGQTSDTLQVTATNSSAGQLQTVDASVPAGDAAWLTAEVAGAGGNTQTINVIVHVAQLPSDVSNSTITVSGGGSPNTVTCDVVVYKGEAIAAPTSLTVAAAGDSLLDAALSWTDNAGNETGYVVERMEEAGAWEEIARTSADATSYTDLYLDYATTYTFRVRAFSDLGGGTLQESGNSNEAAVTIEGIPWIRVDRPLPGEYVKAGEPFTIRWTSNLVAQVRVFLSLNGGRNYVDMNDAGIGITSPLWDNYVPTMPDTETTQAKVKVERYDGSMAGYSELFTISRTTSGTLLAAGYLTQILQLEKSAGGQDAECLDPGDAAGIEAQHVGVAACEGDTITVNGNTYEWRAGAQADGMWADGALDNFVSFWSVTVFSPQQRTVKLGLRHDDDLTAWNNGEIWHTISGWDNNTETITGPLTLESGENRLLFKLVETSGGNWFAVRFLDESENDATGLFYNTSPCSDAAVSGGAVGARGTDSGSPRVRLSGSRGRLALSLDTPERFNVRIYSSSGRLLAYAQGTGPVVLPFDQTATGVYLVEGSVGASRISMRTAVR